MIPADVKSDVKQQEIKELWQLYLKKIPSTLKIKCKTSKYF